MHMYPFSPKPHSRLSWVMASPDCLALLYLAGNWAVMSPLSPTQGHQPGWPDFRKRTYHGFSRHGREVWSRPCQTRGPHGLNAQGHGHHHLKHLPAHRLGGLHHHLPPGKGLLLPPPHNSLPTCFWTFACQWVPDKGKKQANTFFPSTLESTLAYLQKHQRDAHFSGNYSFVLTTYSLTVKIDLETLLADHFKYLTVFSFLRLHIGIPWQSSC